jgi:adenine-specific DNA-methyltransferase
VIEINLDNKSCMKSSVFPKQQTSFITKESWVILNPVEQSIKAKVEATGVPLKSWDINIYRGVLTGLNEAFIIDRNKKDQLILEDPKSAEIIRPILRGRDIKRYGYDFGDQYLLFIPWHFPLHEDPNVTGNSMTAEIAFKAQYPAVYSHLFKYKNELENRNKAETGIRYEWYALQRWGANYWEDFYRQKMVWKRIGSILRFSYDDSGVMALDSTCFATGKHIKFLVAILNSKMGRYLMKDSPKTGTGDLLISVQAIEPLKVPRPSSELEILIENKVDTILSNLKRGISNEITEKDIDYLVYQLYKLSEEEIEFIDLGY